MKVISTTKAPAAIGPYSQAVKKNGMLFISGQLGFRLETGNLAESFEEQVALVFSHLNSILSEAGLSFANVVKASVFLTDMSNFPYLNDVYKQHFNEPFPAREVIEVSGLPRGGQVEISVIAVE